MTAKVEAAAAGHGAEPRGKRTDDGQATYLIAIAEALWEEMERDERVYMLGEDIGVYGGAFKVTEGFIDRFGAERVMDTPIAEETILRSIEKTSRALVLYESHRFLGVGAEVAAMIAEKAFEHLDAPVERLAPPNTPVPFSPPLEDAYLPQVADIEAAVERLSAW